MELTLMKEDVWVVVKSGMSDPEDITQSWIRKDEKARALIGLALEDNQLCHIMEATTAKEMWDKLKGYHERGSLSNKIHILRKLCSMRLVENGNMSDHLVEASELVHRLARMGEPLKEHLVVAVLLSSLPESYDPLVTALEGRPVENLKLDYVKGKLLDQWKRRHEDRVQEKVCEKAMKTSVCSVDRRRQRVCYFCGKAGHFRCDCPLLLKKKKNNEVNIRRNQEIRTAIQSPSAENGGVSQGRGVCFTASTENKVMKERWIIDTGSTKHMTGSLNNVCGRTPCEEEVLLADGRNLTANGCGSGRIIGRGLLGECIDMKLEDLLYVPGLCGNVLSVSRITGKGYSVLFGPTDYRILEGDNVIAVGEKRGGLYYLEQ